MKNFSATIIISLLLTWTLCAQQVNVRPELLTRTWNASWISHPVIDSSTYAVVLFRKKFVQPKKPSSFTIHVSADNRYWLYVNGKRVGNGPARSDLQHWKFETYDIAPYLREGENIISAEVWNEGAFRAWAQFSTGTSFLLQGDGAEEAVLNTNSSWSVLENTAYAPLSEDYRVIPAREFVNLGKYPFGWTELNFKDSHWFAAKELEKAVPIGSTMKSARKLMPRDIPMPEEKLIRFATIRTTTGISADRSFIEGKGNFKIHGWANVKILLDLGELTTAFPQFYFSGGKGAKITFTYMEALMEKETGEEKGNRNEINGKVVRGIYDIILPDGGKSRMWRPLYYRTFRYVEIKIENYWEELVIHDFNAIFTGYPFEQKGAFASDKPLLSTIWNTGWRTARLCAYETYMDCPYYEQLQYIGDTRIQALVSLYVAGDDRLMKNALVQFNNSIFSDGLTKSRYPDYLGQVIPPFSLFWIDMVHDHFMHKNDHQFLKQFLPGIKSVLKWHDNQIDPKTKMLGKMKYWNFVDWTKEWPWTGREIESGVPAGTLEGGSSILTLQYVYALQRAAELFANFGEKATAALYQKQAETYKKAVYAVCFDKVRGLLADTPDKKIFSQHANVLGILTSTFPVSEEKNIMNRILSQENNLIQCTIYYRFYLNQALKKAGLGDKYIDLLKPWEDMLNLGLTTFAEKPEPSRSDCHAWSASPNYDLLATVIGVEPASPGFKTVRIKPNLGTLNKVSGIIPHPEGEILVELVNQDNKISGTVTLPGNLKGEFLFKGKTTTLNPGKQKVEL